MLPLKRAHSLSAHLLSHSLHILEKKTTTHESQKKVYNDRKSAQKRENITCNIPIHKLYPKQFFLNFGINLNISLCANTNSLTSLSFMLPLRMLFLQ